MTETNGLPIWQVDAFASRPFEGNPAAICILDQFPSSQWMLHVAKEMNLSETAFVVPSKPRPDSSQSSEDSRSASVGTFDLRWFTPGLEVDLCGHATLASAHLLYELGKVDPSVPIQFSTRSGILTCEREGQCIAMDFPARPASDPVDEATQAELRQVVGDASEIAKSKEDILMVFDSAKAIEDLNPEFERLKKVSARGVIATAVSDDPSVDFVSRFFAPQSGINEDPVTGSAHCVLAPYWSERLGNNALTGRQGKDRRGIVHTQWLGERVRISGPAVTVLTGQLQVSTGEVW